MSDTPVFAERIFELDGVPFACRFLVPFEMPTSEYRCVAEVDFPGKPFVRRVYGLDGVQALHLAMALVHTEMLLYARERGAQLTWCNEPDLGLPDHYPLD